MEKYYSRGDENTFYIVEPDKTLKLIVDKDKIIKECIKSNEKEPINSITKDSFLIQLAFSISKVAHENQVDKAGNDYFSSHIAAVVSSAYENQPDEIEVIITAYLHDLFEDTNFNQEDVKELFGEKVYEAISLLTKDKNVDYLSYIANIKDNPIAKSVKLYDLLNNSNLNRLGINNITIKDIQRSQKYLQAMEFLKG